MAVRYNRGRFATIGTRIAEAVRKGTETAARSLPDYICDELEVGRRPSDGASQPALAPSTIEAKRRQGQPLIPGVATGVLSTASNWRVTTTANGWVIEPPPSRADAVYYLERMPDPYEVIGIPPKWAHTDLPRQIQAELNKVK